MKKSTAKGASHFFLWMGGLIIICLPLVRFVEAGLRCVFMTDHYRSFREGLKKDIWFSEGWQAYIKTPLGLTMTLLPFVLIGCAIVCFICAVNSRPARRSKQAEQDRMRR